MRFAEALLGDRDVETSVAEGLLEGAVGLLKE